MRACLVHRQGPGASSSGAHAQNNERLLATTLSGALFRRERLPLPVSMKRWLFFVCCIANPIQRRAVVFRRPGFSFTPPTSSSSSSVFAISARPASGQGGRAAERGLGRTLVSRFDANRHTPRGALPSFFSFSPPSSSRSRRIEGTSARSAAFSSYWVPRSRGRTLHHAPTESRVFLGHEAAVPDVSCELEHRSRERAGLSFWKSCREIASGPPRSLVCLSFRPGFFLVLLLSTHQCSGHGKHLHAFYCRAWERQNEILRFSFFGFFKT